MSILLRGIYLANLPDAVLDAALDGDAEAYMAVQRARRQGARLLDVHGAPGSLLAGPADGLVRAAQLGPAEWVIDGKPLAEAPAGLQLALAALANPGQVWPCRSANATRNAIRRAAKAAGARGFEHLAELCGRVAVTRAGVVYRGRRAVELVSR